MYLKILFALNILIYCIEIATSSTKRITFINADRPVILYTNKNHITNVSINSRRMSRADPRHYVNIYVETLDPWGNNIKVDFYFYEYIQTNKYRRSFLEMHFRLCDMIEKDRIFGSALKRNLMLQNKFNCPYPAGHYELVNMTIPYVPSEFPFTRGRVYCNITLEVKTTSTLISYGYIDIEVKSMNVKQ